MAVALPVATQDQKDHAAFLVRSVRGMDTSGPGCGKTLTALLALKQSGANRVLVVAPPIALRMWCREILAHTGWEPYIVRSGAAASLKGLDEYRVIVVSEGLIAKDTVKTRLATWVGRSPSAIGPGTAVIADEAHAYKSISAKRTEALYGRRALRKGGIIEAADFVWGLTGTPVRKYFDDLFPHFKALRPDLLDRMGCTSLEAFQRKFCYMQLKSYHPRQQPKMVVVGNKSIEIIKPALLGPDGLAVRRTLSSMIEHLPPLTIQDAPVEYDDTAELREATSEVYDFESEGGAAATVRRLLGIAKAPHVMQKSWELQQSVQQPVLVFFWHKEVVRRLTEHAFSLGVDPSKVGVIDGSTSAGRKAELEDRFNAGDLDFLFGQIASMGVSLNLQANQFADFAEPDWSPGNMEQAYKRLFRMGQKKHVFIRIFIADHPSDDAAVVVYKRKQADIDRTLGKG